MMQIDATGTYQAELNRILIKLCHVLPGDVAFVKPEPDWFVFRSISYLDEAEEIEGRPLFVKIRKASFAGYALLDTVESAEADKRLMQEVTSKLVGYDVEADLDTPYVIVIGKA